MTIMFADSKIFDSPDVSKCISRGHFLLVSTGESA